MNWIGKGGDITNLYKMRQFCLMFSKRDAARLKFGPLFYPPTLRLLNSGGKINDTLFIILHSSFLELHLKIVRWLRKFGYIIV